MRRSVLSLLAATAALSLGFAAPTWAAEDAVVIPAPAMDAAPASSVQTAVIAGGCFWGVQGVFQHTAGVVNAVSGYAGGNKSTADYQTVSTGTTGHAESVRVTYDPRKVSYGSLLRIYFSVIADPTRLNAQGPDHGPQYRTALFPQNERQLATAKAYLAQLSAARLWDKPIVTRIERAQAFYPAEAYHQDFMAKNPAYPYIVVNDAPKVAALKRLFPLSYKG
jgi:peptide-methionine (S)-S-oxide reductase